MIDVRGINVHSEMALRQFFAAHGIVTAYLFGSQASGRAHNHSDYDLGILFQGYHPERHNFSLRLALAEDLALLLGRPVDLVFLQGAAILMRFEILSTGKVVFCTDDDFRTDFEDIAYRDYLDYKPFIAQFYKDETEAVRDGYFFAKP